LGIALTVASIVRPIISLDRGKSAKEGADAMVTNNIGSIVVSDRGSYVGIVTERDLVKKVIAAGKDPKGVSLGEVMSSPLVTIETKSGLGEATSLMLQHNIRRLAAVDRGKVVGIFTQRDLQQKVDEVFRSLAEVQTLS
jgi:CBS domain-containing protein